MQRVSKRVMSWLLTLAVIVSMIPTALAAVNNTTERHKVATKLSNQAEAYYTGPNSIDNLYKLSGNSSGKSYDSMDSDLYRQLNNLMESTMTNSVSYSSLTSHWKITDTDSRGQICFYGDARETGPNREHTWAKSNGSFYQTGAGSDIHHLRPTNTTLNSNRGNAIMGNVRGIYANPKASQFGGKEVLWTVGDVAGNDENGRVEVADYVKGDVARIFLYVYVRWEQPNLFETVPQSKLPPFDRDDSKNTGMRAIESLETLLQWCEMDPVDEWEISRNDLTQDIQGNRNVFIDYPELAWKLFDKPVPANMPTPSGKGDVPPPDPQYTVNVLVETPGTVSYSAGRITATPAEGYYTAGATVSPAHAASVIQNGNSFTVSNVKENCTILVRFEPKQMAAIGYALPEGVTTSGPASGYLGEAITLPTVVGTPKDNDRGYTFVGWVDATLEATTNPADVTIRHPGQSYMLTNASTLLYGLYSYRVDGGTGTANTFALVKAAPPDWSGDYVMTSPDADFVANGITKSDSSIDLSGSGIVKDGDTLSNVAEKYVITVAKVGSNYSMQLKGDSPPKYYSYSGSGNSLSTAADPTDIGTQWKISYNAGKVTIESVKTPGRMLQSNGALFRCYTNTQPPVKPIELYAASGSYATYYLTLSEDTPPPDPTPIPAAIGYAVPEGVTVADGPTKGEVGKPITLPSISGKPNDTAKDYAFLGWVDQKVEDTTTRPTVYAAGTQYTVRAAATKLYALYSYVTAEPGGGGGEAYTLVKDGVSLEAGDKIIIVNKNLDTTKQHKDESNPGEPRNAYYALGAQAGKSPNTFRTAVKVTKDGDTVAVAPGVEEITLERGTATNTFALKLSSGNYLSAVGTGNYVGEEAEKSAKSAWNITVDMAGNAVFVASEGEANRLRYNPGKDPNNSEAAATMVPRYSAYKSTSGTAVASSDINIYKKTTGGSTGTVDETHYLTLSEGGPVIPPPDPDPIPANIGYAVPEGVTVVNGPAKSEVGKAITLPDVSGSPEDASRAYEFKGWVEDKVEKTDSASGLTILVPGATYPITKQAVKFYALYSYSETEPGNGEAHILVKDGGALAVDDKLVVVAKSEDKALSTTENTQNNNIYATDITKTADTVTIDENVAVLTLKAGTPEGFFAFETEGKYLAAIGGKNNLGKEEAVSANSSWKITVAADGVATIVAENAEQDSKYLRFKTGDPGYIWFSCYKESSSVPAPEVMLYKLGPAGGTTTTYYLTLAEGDDVPPPETVVAPTASPRSGEVAKNTAVTLSCATDGASIHYSLNGATPTGSSTRYTAPIVLTENTTLKFIAVKDGMIPSAVVTEHYTVKNEGGGPGPGTGGGGSGGGSQDPATPIVKAEDVKVDDGSAEIKLPSADAKLDEAANKKAVSANATKPLTINGGGMKVIIPTGTLTTGADVNAMLVNLKSSGNVIKVTKPDGSTAILPIATVSGGQAAYVANIPGTYEIVDNTKAFPDTSGHWAVDAIGFASAHELFKGDATGSFNPDQPMTRGMLATVLARIDGGKTATGTNFADVPAGSWYAKEITWAAQNKLVEGDGKNFVPHADLTREQLCVILVRYLNYSGLTLDEATAMGSFTDLGSVSPWAKDAVEQAVKSGLLSGKNDGLLDPQGKATRAEISTILQRFVEGVLK